MKAEPESEQSECCEMCSKATPYPSRATAYSTFWCSSWAQLQPGRGWCGFFRKKDDEQAS